MNCSTGEHMFVPREIRTSTVMGKQYSDLDSNGFGIRYEKYLTPGYFSGSEAKVCLHPEGACRSGLHSPAT